MIKLLLLCGDTNRAKSYASILKKHLKCNITGLLYGIEKEKITKNIFLKIDKNTQEYFNSEGLETPELNKDIETIFKENQWNYSIVEERNVNHVEIINKINSIESDFVIFAGYGGQILSKEHFIQDKKYVHCHPGWLPLERGSTTLYYSLLNSRELSVTSFFMTEKIDEGNMILRESYPPPNKFVNIDTWLDNSLRADTLSKSIKLIENNYTGFSRDKNTADEEYYVIHPLLKHIALLSLSIQN